MPLSLSPMFFSLILLSLYLMLIQRQHLLMVLLLLELMILSLTIFSSLTLINLNSFFLLILLTFGACEASMGLALLISMTRTFGSDMINLLSINKC